MPSTPRYAYATPQTEIGVALETTRGTAETPKFWVPVKAPKYDPDLMLIPDETLQGSMVQIYNMVPGLRYDKHGWDSYPYLDSFPVFVAAELGSPDTVTASSAATTLAAAATAGATSVEVAAAVTANTYIVIGSTGTLETHLVTAVTTTTPITATLATPLIYNQPSGATVTGLTSHQFSLLNNAGQGDQPPSVTLTDFDGEEWRQLTAAQIDELTIKGNATGFVEYTCTWLANPATTPTAPTVSYTTTQAVPGWSSYVSIGGTLLDTAEDWEIDLKRNTKPIPALTGTQEYYMYFANTLDCTGKVTFVEQSGAPQLTEYLAGTRQSLDITVNDLGSGFALNLHSTESIWKTGNIDRSKEYVSVPMEVQLLPSAADATAGGQSPLSITVANAQTTAYWS